MPEQVKNQKRMETQYDRAPEFNQEDGEVMSQAPDIGALAVLNKSEIDQQIATARRFPRSITNFRKEALQLATLDEKTAQECIYALPRREFDKQEGKWVDKTIEGPSARFAEIINYAWGNTRAGARTIGEDGNFIKSQGLFYDLEKNTAISYEVSRRITNAKGEKYKDDMIGNTANAACSIALRNAVCKGIPKALWKPIYDAARSVVAGDIRTLANRRSEAIKEFAIFGITQERICQVLCVAGVSDIGIDQLVVLKGILTAIKEGETTPEQAFATSATEVLPDTSEMSADDKKLHADIETVLRAQGKNAAQITIWINQHKATLREDLEKIKAADAAKGNGHGTSEKSSPPVQGKSVEADQPPAKTADPAQTRPVPVEDPLTITAQDTPKSQPAKKATTRSLF